MALQAAASKGGRVLVVDDEPMVRDTLGQVLADEGYIVDVAVDGGDALARVHANRPDAILLDLMMPGLTGIELCELLHNDPRFANIPVVIVSARDDPASMEKAFQVGAKDYITKNWDSVVGNVGANPFPTAAP